MRDKPQWSVLMRVERHVTVTVEADDQLEASQKASAWDIIGDEIAGDTIDQRVIRVQRDAP